MSASSSIREVLAKRIAGEIVFSPNPGVTMRKWRDLFNVTQIEVANILDLSSSVISDYEKGRRRSPGSNFIKRYVEALLEIDSKHGGIKIRQLARISLDPNEVFLDIREFSAPITASKLVDAVKGETVVGEELLDKNVFGYTIVDSIKVIRMLSGLDFYRIFGSTSERALVFTRVSRGRSPMIAVRISPFKPRIIVLHGLKGKLDPLAANLAKSDGIPLVVSRIKNEEELVEALLNIYRELS
jgi:putative transcriptional regulator